jgi:hypothetical protein
VQHLESSGCCNHPLNPPLGIWALIDFIVILIGKFTDKQGNALAR